MTTDGSKAFFRLVLSYHERAQAELRNWDEISTTRKLDRTNFDLVRAKYAAHERDAAKLVKSLRQAADHQIPGVEAPLRQKQRTQRKLIEAVAAGGMDPHKANEQNRALTAEITELTARLDELKAIVSAESTEALGGPVILPLDEYPKHIGAGADFKVPRRRLTPQEKNIVAGVVMLTLVLGTVFVLAFVRSVVRVDFSVSSHDLPTGFVSLVCKNTGNRPVNIYVPWPNGQPRVPAGTRTPGNSFGVLVFVREAGSREYRLLEDAEGIWRYRGTLLDSNVPIEVPPKITASIYLDLNLLAAKGMNPEAVAVEFSRSGGGGMQREEIEVPK